MNRRLLLLTPILTIITSCGKSDILTTLKAIVTAVSAVIPYIPGLTIQVQQLVKTYLTMVLAGVEQATTILASSESPQVKASMIASAFARIVKPTLPPGTLQTITDLIDVVANAVAEFLKSNAAMGAAKPSTATSRKATLVTQKDKDTLKQIANDAKQLREKVR